MTISDLISSSKKSEKISFSLGMHERFLLKMVMLFSFSLSLTLSLIFWWSVGSRLAESVLYLMFALVFELCKFISLPMAIKHSKQDRIFTLNLTIYLLLTILSVLSSIGGIGSCFSNNQAQAIESSSEYQTITRQIENEQILINNELVTVQADLRHNYRTQAQELMGKEIPQQQQVLDQLRQQRDHINATELPPSLSLLKMFSENLSISFNNLQNLFVMMISTLIELISTYLIIISMAGYKKTSHESSPAAKRFSEISQTNQEASIDELYADISQELINATNNTSEILENISDYPKNFHEKYEKVLGNVKNNLYECNITKIMKHEKIGYKLAKLIIEKLTKEEMQHAH